MMFFLLVTLSIAFINGCVTTEVFQKTTQNQDENIQTVRNIAEANERKIENLRTESKSEFARLDGSVDGAMAKGTDALKQAEIAAALAKKLSKSYTKPDILLSTRLLPHL